MASTNLQMFKCGVCGAEVEVVRGGGGTLMCCGQPMDLLTENSTDAAQEKHVPVVEKSDDVLCVKVGSVPHPMEEDHYIEWVETICCDGTYRQVAELKPGQEPEAKFPACCGHEATVVRAYCNVHGLWKA